MSYRGVNDQRKSGRATIEARKRRRMRPSVLALEERTLLSTFTVNNPTDTPVAGEVDLRQAIADANTTPGANTINFSGTVFNTPRTIILDYTELTLSNTTGPVTITGPAGGVTVSGGEYGRVFLVDEGVTASISGLTITGGNAFYGGGIEDLGATTLINCTVSGNSAYFGGGVDSGTYYNRGATTALINCTVSGNSAYGGGGGIFSYRYGSTAALINTIVAGNTSHGSASDIGGTVSGNNNLIGAGGSGGLVNGVDGNLVGVSSPGLARLRNYGGTSETVALLPGSPAIDAGTSGAGIPATDQRGLGRVGAVDIGAFESQGFTLTPVAGSTPQMAQIGTPFANPLAVNVTANNPIEPVNGGALSFVANRVDGATAIFSASSAVIAGGQAAVTAEPNNAVGSYTVVASAIEGSATIALTNTGPAFATLVVNTISDSPIPGADLLSLREAIAFANFDSSGISSITFDATVFSTPWTITLSGTELELSNTTETETITGPAGGVAVNGAGTSRVFQVDPNVTASISGMTIIGGNAVDDYGGGLKNLGTTTLTNCTVNGNSARYGGGVATGGGATTTLINCTVSGNSAQHGGGIYTHLPGGTSTLINTIVAGNTSYYTYTSDIDGTVSGNNNLIGKGGSSGLVNGVDGNLVGVANPGLAPPGNYGGTTQTIALLPGSPAINAGASGPNIPATDERGLGRVGAVDIGAFESQGFNLSLVPGSTPQTSKIGTPFANPLAVTVTANNPVEPIDGGVVSFAANPASNGATALVSAASAVIASGQAAITAEPNNVDGSYQVVASAAGSSAGSFALTNIGPVFTSLVVNTTIDSIIPGAGLISLREAIGFANTAPLGSSASITFSSSVFNTAKTITLTGGQLELSNTSKPETITGPAAGVTISGGRQSGVFQVDPNVTASISGLTITDGSALNGEGLYNQGGTVTIEDCLFASNGPSTPYLYDPIGGAVDNTGVMVVGDTTFSGNRGGGIHNLGTLTVSGSSFTSNVSLGFGSGGGIDNNGTLNVSNSTFDDNECLDDGGGIYTSDGAFATLLNCTISGNTAINFSGGGVGNSGVTALTNCTLSGNTASALPFFNGGGLANYGSVTLAYCTISGNSAFGGGGVANDTGTATLIDCAVTGNSAAFGGGLIINGTATLTNCTISSNFASLSTGGLANLGALTLTNCAISGNSSVQVGGLGNYATATLTNCTISGNSADGGFAGGLGNNGGALTLTNCNVSGNVAASSGGGLATGGTATLTNCTVTGNSAGIGGGLYNSGTLNITFSRINNNTAASAGGGISTTGGSATITTSQINSNQVNSSGTAVGGGIDCENSNLSLTYSTVNSNQVNGADAYGGGIYALDSTADVEYCAVTGNQADGSAIGEGGGIYAFDTNLTLVGTAVKGNKATTAYNDIYNGP